MEPEEATIRPHWLTQKGTTPFQFGLSFLILVAIPLTLWSLYADQDMPTHIHGTLYITYLKNISWSLSLLIIFPLFLGLSLHFYNTYPSVLQHLYYTTTIEPDQAFFHRLCKKIDHSANHKLIPFAAIFVAALYTAYIYISQLSNADVTSWMTNGTYLSTYPAGGDSGLEKGFTNRGVVAFIIQVILTAWLLIFVTRSLLFIRGLFDLFSSKEANIRLDPYHPDNLSGLARLSQLATLQAMMMCLIGLYVSLKIIDRIYFQQISIFTGIGNSITIASYVVIAPTVYFLTLGSAYNKMREAKEVVVSVFSNKIKEVINEIKTETDAGKNDQYLVYLKNLEERKSSLDNSILVLPFHIKTLQGFFSAVLTPLIAPLIMGAIQLIKLIKEL